MYPVICPVPPREPALEALNRPRRERAGLTVGRAGPGPGGGGPRPEPPPLPPL